MDNSQASATERNGGSKGGEGQNKTPEVDVQGVNGLIKDFFHL
jgi:hypothetical protein